MRDEPAGATHAGRKPVRTIFIGSGGFGMPTLRILAGRGDVELVGVVTAPPRRAGRRHDPNPTPIERTARVLRVEPILTPERLRAPEAIAAILELDPALAVLADYGQIVPRAILDLPHAALNLHPSLLPRHRGATPIPAAILAGDAETGVTVIRMDDGIDTGPIVGQERVSLGGAETTPELEDRLSAVGAELVALTLGPWLSGELAARPQDEAAATLTRPLRREDGRLRAGIPARQVERQVRAYTPWPGSFVETAAGRLIVLAATVDAAAAGRVGTIDRVGLNTVEGRLAFERVQPAGGRAMAWADYLRGGPKLVGSSIVE